MASINYPHLVVVYGIDFTTLDVYEISFHSILSLESHEISLDSHEIPLESQ